MAIEQCDLAEQAATVDDVEHQFLTVSRIGADLHPSANHCHHAAAGVAFLKNRHLRPMANQRSAGGNAGKFLGPEVPQQEMACEYLFPVRGPVAMLHRCGPLSPDLTVYGWKDEWCRREVGYNTKT